MKSMTENVRIIRDRLMIAKGIPEECVDLSKRILELVFEIIWFPRCFKV